MILATKPAHHRGALLLILTTLIWGTSFPILKQTLDSLSPATILLARFVIAALAFAPWLRSVTPALVRDGVLLGGLYFLECTSALLGLETISANRSAFLISLNVILVPLLATLLGRKLSWRVGLAAGVALSGVGLMSWQGGGLSRGDWLTLGCAIGVALYILALEAVTPRHPTLPLVAVQLSVMAVLSGMWALPQVAQQGSLLLDQSPTLLYLGLIVTATPIWTQAIAQRWVPAHEAALLYTLEPVFAAGFSIWLLGETLGLQSLLGAGLILMATVFSQSNWQKNA